MNLDDSSGMLPRVLLVDDEPAILDGLRRQLRRQFDVSTAVGGAAALELMDAEAPYAVVMSDMRMPGMDGAAFLSVVRERWPDTVRMLLTGQADMHLTIAAINDGHVYRFLTKPCAADTVQAGLRDAAELHRQITAERDVLERTLHGAVHALLDAMSMASPRAFGRALRVSKLVSELAETIGVPLDWELGIAGMLAQLGAVTVPTALMDKLEYGMPLSRDEQAMLSAVPGVSERLIQGIPRLGPLATAIGQQALRYDGLDSRPGDPVGEAIPLAARLLKMAIDIERMRSQRLPAATIRKQMRQDAGAYDPRLLDVWESSHVDPVTDSAPFTVEIEELEAGMVLAEDVFSTQGLVLLGRGSSVTETLLRRLRNHAERGDVAGNVIVTLPDRSRDPLPAASGDLST